MEQETTVFPPKADASVPVHRVVPVLPVAPDKAEHPVTQSHKLQLTFRDYIASNGRRTYLIGGMFIPVFIPLFGFTDALIYPSKLKLFLWIRLSLSVVGLLTLLTTYLVPSYWSVVIASATGGAVTAAGVSLIGYLGDGYRSPYFAGVGVVLTASTVFMVWPTWVAVLVVLFVYLVHFLPAFVFGIQVPLSTFLVNSSLLVTFGIICVAAVQVRLGMARQEYGAKRALAESHGMLEEINKTKDQLFQNISHEFRTPLALILAPVESLLEGHSAEETPTRKKLTTVRDNALRLLNLINDLLDLAKLDAVGIKATKIPVPVGPAMRVLGEQAVELAKRQGLSMHVDVGPQLSVYLLDPKFLEKVLLNLLSNAFKFTPRGGTVRLMVRDEPSSGLTVSVQDTGPGIPREAQTRVFERFKQVDGTSTRSYGGTGIGLALVKELAELMGGSITLQSEVGQGSTFSLHFPWSLRAEDQVAREQAGSHESDSAISEFSRRASFAVLGNKERSDAILERGEHGPRIILAEDDPELRLDLAELLAPHYRVLGVPNGQVALERASANPPDLILSDVMMPEMDGLTLASEIRKHPRLRDLPVILLSARADLEDRVAGRKLGVDTYLTKPYQPREVLATIEGLLRSRMRIVGDYILHEMLGSGGQSDVYRAEHRSSHAEVALKLLGKGGSQTTDVERMRREGEALQKMSHPNIIKVLDAGFHADHAYLVMELLKGKSLTYWVDRHRRLSAGLATGIAVAVLDALSEVHAAGIVHRDIKGGNVMLLEQGQTVRERVRLIDFGIIQALDLKTLSSEGQVVGTAPFLAPELLQGASASPATDIYATGVLLFWMCTGELPFGGNSRARLSVQILKGNAGPMSALNPAVPKALDDVVSRALAPVGARWPSAGAMRDALLALGLEVHMVELRV